MKNVKAQIADDRDKNEKKKRTEQKWSIEQWTQTGLDREQARYTLYTIIALYTLPGNET